MPAIRTLRRAAATTGVAAMIAVGIAAAPAGAAGSASDSKIAKAGTIVQTDLPSGWTGSPSDDSGDKAARKAAAGYPECKDYLLLGKSTKAQPNADSKDWALGNEAISNKVAVYQTTKAASKAMVLASSPDMSSCLTSTFQSVLGDELAKSSQSANVASYKAVINTVSGLPSVGDDVVGYSGGVQINMKDGSSEQILTGTAIVRVGRALILYTFSAPPTATDYATALDNAIAQTVARTAKAQK